MAGAHIQAQSVSWVMRRSTHDWMLVPATSTYDPVTLSREGGHGSWGIGAGVGGRQWRY